MTLDGKREIDQDAYSIKVTDWMKKDEDIVQTARIGIREIADEALVV